LKLDQSDHPTHPFIGLPPPETELDLVDMISMLISHSIIEPLRTLWLWNGIVQLKEVIEVVFLSAP
jgi:hypothetical protein